MDSMLILIIVLVVFIVVGFACVRSNVPSLNTYSEIYDLAFEYMTENKNKQDLKKILKQTTTLNKPIEKEDIFKLCSIASWLGGLREFKDVKIICNKILIVDSKNYQAIVLLLNIARHENNNKLIFNYSNQLLESDFQKHINEIQPTLKSNIQIIKDSIKRMADQFQEIGEFFMQTKNFKKAKRSYEIAFKIDPLFFEAHHNIGIALYKLKFYKEAVVTFEKNIEILETKSKEYLNHPKRQEIHNRFLSRIYFNIGKSYYRMNLLAEARKYFGLSIKLDETMKNEDVNKKIEEFLSVLEHDLEM